jgi:hypothetical protein
MGRAQVEEKAPIPWKKHCVRQTPLHGGDAFGPLFVKAGCRRYVFTFFGRRSMAVDEA